MESLKSGGSSKLAGMTGTPRRDWDESSHRDNAGADFLGTKPFGRDDQAADECIAGIHRSAGEDQDVQGHRPSQVGADFSRLVRDVLKEAEALVRRYPWPTLLIGFALGYLLSSGREK